MAAIFLLTQNCVLNLMDATLPLQTLLFGWGVVVVDSCLIAGYYTFIVPSTMRLVLQLKNQKTVPPIKVILTFRNSYPYYVLLSELYIK